MPGEIWTYKAVQPNDGSIKNRPILIIGNDKNNQLKFVDIHYVLISSSAEKGKYDIEVNDYQAKNIGLSKKSIIKTTKIYTGSKSKLGNKINDLPRDLMIEFLIKYKDYQANLIEELEIIKVIS